MGECSVKPAVAEPSSTVAVKTPEDAGVVTGGGEDWARGAGANTDVEGEAALTGAAEVCESGGTVLAETGELGGARLTAAVGATEGMAAPGAGVDIGTGVGVEWEVAGWAGVCARGTGAGRGGEAGAETGTGNTGGAEATSCAA